MWDRYSTSIVETDISVDIGRVLDCRFGTRVGGRGRWIDAFALDGHSVLSQVAGLQRLGVDTHYVVWDVGRSQDVQCIHACMQAGNSTRYSGGDEVGK